MKYHVTNTNNPIDFPKSENLMNERIFGLALQAKLGPALLLHHYGTVDALTDTEQEGLEQIEKFAELIVRECAGIYSKIDNGNLHMGTDDYLEALHKTFWS